MSEAGLHHNFDSNSNQDAVTYRENEDYFAMVLADGISMCKSSGAGARLTCQVIVNCLMEQAGCFFKSDADTNIICLIHRTLHELKKLAAAEGNPLEDYSSTAACVLLDKKTGRMFYYSLGDSLILSTREGGCRVVAMPADSRHGCYCTTTRDVQSTVSCDIINTAHINSVMICSDGAWRLMYERARLKDQVRSMLIDCDYQGLRDTLIKEERYDDCSFISVDLSELRG